MALFPRRNACFENRPPAIEIPGHYIVGETIRECLEESADADRMDAVLRGLEDGSIAARFVAQGWGEIRTGQRTPARYLTSSEIFAPLTRSTAGPLRCGGLAMNAAVAAAPAGSASTPSSL